MLGIALAALLVSGGARADTCSQFDLPKGYTVLDFPVLESSGLAESPAHPGRFYTHNDSGNQNTLYAYQLDGTVVGSWFVYGTSNTDWEDLAAAPCPDGSPCLYIADTGDNIFTRETVVVWLVNEPDGLEDHVGRLDKWEARYPDGVARNVEAMAVHPCSGAVYLLTKSEIGDFGVWTFPDNAGKNGNIVDLVHVADGTLPDPTGLSGANWNATGDQLALRSATTVYLWNTDLADPDAHWTKQPAKIATLDELNGEAIAIDHTQSIITTTEDPSGIGPMRGNVVACLNAAPSEEECAFTPDSSWAACGQCATGPAGGGGFALAVAAWAGLRRVRAGSAPARSDRRRPR